MPIEFREVRRGEIDDALTFATAQGADISAPAIRHQLSLVAINTQKSILGSALHEVTGDGRRRIHIHLNPDIHPGLGRLLIDRALRKAEGANIATAQVAIQHETAEQTTWKTAEWPSPSRPDLAESTKPPVDAAAATPSTSAAAAVAAEEAPACESGSPIPGDESVAAAEASAKTADAA